MRGHDVEHEAVNWLACASGVVMGTGLAAAAGQLVGQGLAAHHAKVDHLDPPLGVCLVAINDDTDTLPLVPQYLGRRHPWSRRRRWAVVLPSEVALALVHGQARLGIRRLPPRTSVLIRGTLD